MQSPVPSRLSLTRQLLIFQLCLIAIVLVAVTAITLEQTRGIFASGQMRRMLTVAEYSAGVPLLRSLLTNAPNPEQLAAPVESLRTTSGVDQLIVTDAAGRVLASPADPRQLGSTLTVGPTAGGSNGSSNGAWSGAATIDTLSHIVARVPILSDSGRLVGTVIAAREFRSFGGLLADAAPNLLTYLGVAGVLGTAGSMWLAARVKRQTLGLEPDQIAKLVEHREAMLHGIREGVVSVDADDLITLANDSARILLNLPTDAVGRRIDDVGLDDEAVRVLRGPRGGDALAAGTDALSGSVDTGLVNRGMMLVLNQTTIHPPRSTPEVVTTLRDRTELVTLQHDLGSSMQATDTLRAQTHDFANRLHTVSMLIQLGDTDAAVEYIDAVSRDRSQLDSTVLTRIAEPAVAALLIAKTSLARERGADLTLSAESGLPRVNETMSMDLVTVIGNLVDNAIDAVTATETRQVEVDIRAVTTGGNGPLPALLAEVQVSVRDSGPGVDAGLRDRMFEAGVSSKPRIGDGADHGFGLAIVRLVTTRRGGQATYLNADGAVFTATLPVQVAAHV